MCLCVRYQIRVPAKKPHYVSDISKLDALLYETHTKVLLLPRLDMFRSIISLSKIANQMWHGQPFSQRNKITERAVRVGVGGDSEGGGS